MQVTKQTNSAIKVGSFSSAPSDVQDGMMYYDLSMNRFRFYQNGDWVENASTDVIRAAAVVDTLAGTETDQAPSVRAVNEALAAVVVSPQFSDDEFRIQDDGDDTKEIAFQASGISPGSTRTITMPDTNVDLGDVASAVQQDGSTPFSADQSMGGNKLTNLAAPVSSTDAVNLATLQAYIEGLKPKQAVRAATTADIDLSSMPATIDGVSLSQDDRFLVKDQNDPTENGIYIFNGMAFAATRATDFDSTSPIDEVNGAYMFVQEGTQAGQGWAQTGTVSTIGTDSIDFVYFNSVVNYTGGDMVTVAGTVISIDLATVSGLESSNAGNAAGQLRIKLEGSNPTLQINGSNELGVKLDGSGAIVTGASGLAVAVDGSTIEKSANALQVKDDGITSAKIAANPNFRGDVYRGDDIDQLESVHQRYIHEQALSSSQTDTALGGILTVPHANYCAHFIEYQLKASNGVIRIGRIMIAHDGTTAGCNDEFSEIGGVTGFSFDAVISGSNLVVNYSSGSNSGTISMDVKRIRTIIS